MRLRCDISLKENLKCEITVVMIAEDFHNINLDKRKCKYDHDC